MQKPRVLFLCTGNSCRSQMAEGWARALWADALVALSAGVRPAELNPLAVQVMAEAGVDISAQRPKHIGELDGAYDCVVTVCDGAREACPALPTEVARIHSAFDDPPRLAAEAASAAEVLAIYRRVRDEIRRLVELLPQHLARPSDAAGSERHAAGQGC